MNSFLAVTVVIALIAIIPESSAIKCYTCLDPTKTCTPSEMESTTCPSLTKMCQKTVAGDLILRSCAPIGISTSDACKEEGNAAVCLCGSDECNHAPAQAPTLALILAVGIFSLLFFK